MHPVDMFIFISIGQVMGWLVTLYADTDHRRLAANLAIATIGAFIGGFLAQNLLSEISKFGMIFSAFFVAGLSLYFIRYRNRLKQMFLDANRRPARGPVPARVSVGKLATSIGAALLLVAAIFLLLGWFKSQQIEPQKFGHPGQAVPVILASTARDWRF